MRTLLHILTRPADDLTRQILLAHQSSAELQVEIVDLTLAEPDYPALVQAIFASDSVQVS